MYDLGPSLNQEKPKKMETSALYHSSTCRIGRLAAVLLLFFAALAPLSGEGKTFPTLHSPLFTESGGLAWSGEELAYFPPPLSGMEVTKAVVDRTKTYGLGGVIAYTIKVKNTGSVTLTNIKVTDSIADVPNVGIIPSLAPGDSSVLTAQHTVTLADVEKGRVDNVALAEGKDPDGNDVSETSKDPDCPKCPSTGVPVDQGDAHGLKVTKTADRTQEYANVGDVIEYRIRVENTGNDPLTDILIVDHNANNVDVVDGVDFVVGKFPDLASKRAQEVIAWHVVTQADANRGYVYNIGLVRAKTPRGNMTRARSVDGDPCADCPVDPGCPDCTVVPIKQIGEIKMVKDAVNPEGPFEVGDKIEYSITVTNTGNIQLTDVVVTDDNADDPDVDTLAVFPAGDSHVFTVHHTVTQDDIDTEYVLNIAKATGKKPNGEEVTAESSPSAPPNGDPKDPNCPTCTEVVIWQEEPEMTLIKDALNPDGPYRLGERIQYTITVENTGNTDRLVLTDVVITDDNADDNLVGRVDTLLIGESHTFTAYHTVTQADMDKGYVLNLAEAKAEDPDGEEVTAESRSSIQSEDEDPFDPDCPSCTVVDLYTIRAEDDHYEVTWLDDSTVGGSVLDNDLLYKLPVDPAKVLLKPHASPHIGMRMDIRDGTIALDPLVEPGHYEYPYLICEVADLDNCAQAVATIIVHPNDKKKVFVPNIFTPNGDGVNDTFEIVGIDKFDRVDLEVVNRWGGGVYHSVDYRNDWGGQTLNKGTYYYIVTLHKDGKMDLVKGTVLIMGL